MVEGKPNHCSNSDLIPQIVDTWFSKILRSELESAKLTLYGPSKHFIIIYFHIFLYILHSQNRLDISRTKEDALLVLEIWSFDIIYSMWYHAYWLLKSDYCYFCQSKQSSTLWSPCWYQIDIMTFLEMNKNKTLRPFHDNIIE